MTGTEPIIGVGFSCWTTFLREVVGELPSGTNGVLRTERADDGSVVLRSEDNGVELSFTRGEWDAFVAGVRAGEFEVKADAATRPEPVAD